MLEFQIPVRLAVSACASAWSPSPQEAVGVQIRVPVTRGMGSKYRTDLLRRSPSLRKRGSDSVTLSDFVFVPKRRPRGVYYCKFDSYPFILVEGNWENLKAVSLPNHSLDLRFFPVGVFVLITWRFRIP